MEFLINLIVIILLIILVALPIFSIRLLTNRKFKNKFVVFLISSIIFGGIFLILFAWWCDYSNILLLKFYGYNIDGMNETELYGKVSLKNLQKVKDLESSIMGIGWPLKAIMLYPFYVIYILVSYPLINMSLKKKNPET